VSCAKTARLVDMQFGMLSEDGSREYALHEDVDAPREWSLLGCLAD